MHSLGDYKDNPALYREDSSNPFHAHKMKQINDKKARVSKIRAALKALLEDTDPMPRYNIINALRSQGMADIAFSPRFTDRTPVYTPALVQARRDLRIAWTAFSPADAAILTPGITQRPPDCGPKLTQYHYWHIISRREIHQIIRAGRDLR